MSAPLGEQCPTKPLMKLKGCFQTCGDTWVPGGWTKAGEGETAQHHQKHYHHQMLCIIGISLDSKSICIVSLSNGGGSALITSIVISISISSISAERNPDKIVVRLVSSAWNLLQGRMRFDACVSSSTRKGGSAQWELSASSCELHWHSWTKEQAASRAISIIIIIISSSIITIIIITIIIIINYEHYDHQDRRIQE